MIINDMPGTKGTVTSVGVKMNGSVKGTVTDSGVIDLGEVGLPAVTQADNYKSLVVKNGEWVIDYGSGMAEIYQASPTYSQWGIIKGDFLNQSNSSAGICKCPEFGAYLVYAIDASNKWRWNYTQVSQVQGYGISTWSDAENYNLIGTGILTGYKHSKYPLQCIGGGVIAGYSIYTDDSETYPGNIMWDTPNSGSPNHGHVSINSCCIQTIYYGVTNTSQSTKWFRLIVDGVQYDVQKKVDYITPCYIRGSVSGSDFPDATIPTRFNFIDRGGTGSQSDPYTCEITSLPF